MEIKHLGANYNNSGEFEATCCGKHKKDQSQKINATTEIQLVNCSDCIKWHNEIENSRRIYEFCPDGKKHEYGEMQLEWKNEPFKWPSEDITFPGRWVAYVKCNNCDNIRDVTRLRISGIKCFLSKDKEHKIKEWDDETHHHAKCINCLIHSSIPIHLYLESKNKK